MALPPSLDIDSLRERLLAGDRAALARAITLAESKRADHRAAARSLIDSVLPQTGTAIRVGITGVPGVGKFPPRSTISAPTSRPPATR